jgi:hypothetical protein
MKRVQLTVRLENEVIKAARERAARMKTSLSAAVAEAAKESLLSSYRTERETEILKAVERNFFALRKLEQRMNFEIRVLKEMAGLGMRSFFNHIPPIPEAEKPAALLSGKMRFSRYLDLLARNLRGGESILRDLPAAEPIEGVEKPSQPSDATSTRSTHGKTSKAAAESNPIKEDTHRVGTNGDTSLPQSTTPAKEQAWSLFDREPSHEAAPHIHPGLNPQRS